MTRSDDQMTETKRAEVRRCGRRTESDACVRRTKDGSKKKPEDEGLVEWRAKEGRGVVKTVEGAVDGAHLENKEQIGRRSKADDGGG